MTLLTLLEYYRNELPEGIPLGGFTLRFYSMAYLFGLILGLWLVRSLARKRRIALTPTEVTDMAIPYALIGVLAGGRLGYCLFYGGMQYLYEPWRILFIWQGGMASHGGMIGVLVALWIFARRRNVPFLHCLDLAAFGSTIGLFLGRVANFINGELWGRTTDVPWAVIFPKADELPRHPSQLYEAFGEGLLLFIVLLLLHRKLLPKTGAMATVFIFGYSIARIVSEQFREPDAHIAAQEAATLGITRGQILTGIMLLCGVYLAVLVAKGKTPKWSPPPEEDDGQEGDAAQLENPS